MLGKRERPRRCEGRVQHKRMRPKASADPTAEQKRYWDSLPNRCEGCGATRDIVVHHLLAPAPGKRGRRDHWFVVKLCALCHNMGTESVHLLGSEAKFLDRRGVDLVAVSIINLERYRGQA